MHGQRNPLSNPSIANKQVQLAGVQYERNPGAEHGDHIKNVAAMCNTSASHTYGNVLAVIEKYILDMFPQDLFKTITASTTLASRQLRHIPTQLQKKENPMMVLIPRVVPGQEDNRFLSHTLINDRVTNTHNTWGGGSLLPLAEDRKRHLYVHGHYNRALMYVDVIMTFDTYSQQIDYMSYIHNMIPVGHPQDVTSPLELYIPEDFCELLSNVAKVPVIQKGSVHKFMSYMNSIWFNPITYKLKGNSNSHEFFMYYLTDIMATIQDPQAGGGVNDGQIKRDFDITFTIRCEFNTVGYFTLNAPNFQKPVMMGSKDKGVIVPMFSDVINLDDFELPQGWQILSWPIFKLDLKYDPEIDENVVENSISIDDALNQSLRVTIDHHLKFGIPMERFIMIQFRENGQILNNEGFYIDWVNRRLYITNPDPHRTYRLIISVSHEYINNLVKEMYHLE